MQINELSKKSGVSVRTIRYYTQIGLLPEVERNGTYKDYPESMLGTLRKIKELQSEFIPLNKIKELLEKNELLNEENTTKNDTPTNISNDVETIPISAAMIYKLTDDVTITVTNGKRLSQEKLNKIKSLL